MSPVEVHKAGRRSRLTVAMHVLVDLSLNMHVCVYIYMCTCVCPAKWSVEQLCSSSLDCQPECLCSIVGFQKVQECRTIFEAVNALMFL